MDTTVANALSAINFGEVQNSGAMWVFPLVQKESTGPSYLTLSEAIKNHLLVITEISEGGSVPTLMVENKADIPVLLLDGEELSGAKQNRVLNTSVLVPSKSKIHAPVSCTEHGRWRYQSRAFSESGYRMSRKMNAKKSESVSMNLKDSMCYESDQCMVWDEIDKFSREKGVHSNTGAMKDVHDREKPVIDKYLKSFPCVPGQHGVFVIVNGEIAGFDMLSRIEAYEKLHNKFIASYAIDADNSLETKREKYTLQEVMDFIKKISSCVESIYKSVGLGNDYRYESETVIGSALLYMDTGIHCSFFAKEESAHSNEERHNISGFSNRMHSRMRTNRH